MTVKELLLIVLGAALANNIAFEKLLGICPVIGGSSGTRKAVVMGISVAAVMLVTEAVAWPVMALLESCSLGYLELFAFVLIVLAVSCLADVIVTKLCKKSLGVWLGVITLNSAVLGIALINAASGLAYVPALFSALGAGLGFLLAALIFSGVRGRINEKYVPAAFRGLPVELLAASIIAMALVCFK